MKQLLNPVTREPARDAFIAVRVTEQEKSRIEDLADRSLQSVSELLRLALNAYAAGIESTERVVTGPEAEALFQASKMRPR